MVCTTKIQAERVAKAGAAKMDAQGYCIENSGFRALYNRQFRIFKGNEKTSAYTVSIEEGKTFCTCAFFRGNREFGTCKHIEKCREEAARQAWYDAMTEGMEDYANMLASYER
jgi:predicted nucleic acid-binding Zn finger protein